MVAEQLIFTVIAFTIFVYMFFRMIKNNDTSYVIILTLEAVGIALNFIEVLFSVKLNTLFIILKYLFAILIPIVVIIIEKRDITLFELINISKAKMCILFGDEKKAKEILFKLIDKNKESYKGHLLLAQIYEQEGGMRKAIDEYVQAIELNKKDYESYYKVSKLLNDLDKKDEAAQMLNNLLNKKPDMLEASELLGDILIEKEMFKEAVNVYQEALKYTPINYELYYNLGIAYTMLNDFQNAKMSYEKAAQLNSLSYNSKYSLAQIALIYKDLEEAEKRFLEAIEDEELSAEGYFELAKIYLIKRDKDTAIKYINTAIDIDSKNIVEKVKNEALFIPIMTKISMPFNLEEQQIENKKMTEKDKKVKKHLEEMCDKTRHLSYNDISLLKKHNKDGKGITKKENIQIKDDQQKEIQ